MWIKNVNVLTPVSGKADSLSLPAWTQSCAQGSEIIAAEGLDVQIDSNGRFSKIQKSPGISGGTIPKLNAGDIDGTGRLMIPGFVNAHTHLPMIVFRGAADDLALHDWLEQEVFPREAKHLSEDLVYWATAWSCLEAMKYGVTCVADMYMYADRVADAIDFVGMRGFASQSFINFPTPDNKDFDGSDFRRAEALREKYPSNKGARVQAAASVHAPYTSDDALLTKGIEFANQHDQMMFIHMLESQSEIDQSLKEHGVRPLERLTKLGYGTSGRCVFAHGVYIQDDDLNVIQGLNIGVSYNPMSNMKLGSGIAPIPSLIEHGIPVGIGSDGLMSHNSANFFQDLKMSALLQKLAAGSGAGYSAADAFFSATQGGADLLGLGETVGSIEIGKSADCVLLDLSAPTLTWGGPSNWLSHVAYALTGDEVQDVFIDGTCLYRDKSFTQSSIETMIEECRKVF